MYPTQCQAKIACLIAWLSLPVATGRSCFLLFDCAAERCCHFVHETAAAPPAPPSLCQELCCHPLLCCSWFQLLLQWMAQPLLCWSLAADPLHPSSCTSSLFLLWPLVAGGYWLILDFIVPDAATGWVLTAQHCCHWLLCCQAVLLLTLCVVLPWLAAAAAGFLSLLLAITALCKKNSRFLLLLLIYH